MIRFTSRGVHRVRKQELRFRAEHADPPGMIMPPCRAGKSVSAAWHGACNRSLRLVCDETEWGGLLL